MQVKLSKAHVERATNLLLDRVYQPVFFAKLAQYGIQPRNQEEAQLLLKLAAHLRQTAIQNFGVRAVIPDPPTPAEIDAAKKYSESDQQVKAAAYVYSQITK